MAVNVSKIPNNNKFDPVREAILDLQGQIEDTGTSIGNGTLTINTSSPLTGTGTFTANQAGPTTINIGIDGAEYLTNITHDTVNQKLVVTYGDGTTADLSLAQYIDDTNLARLVSGTVNSTTGIATFTRDDDTTFTVDFSGFLEDDTLDSVTTRNNVTTNTISIGGADITYQDANSKIRLQSGSFADANDRYEILATGDVLMFQYWDNDQGNGTSVIRPLAHFEWGGAADNDIVLYGDVIIRNENSASPEVDVKVLDMDVNGGVVNLTNINDGTFAGDLTADTVTATTTLTVGTTNVYNNLPDGISWSDTDNRLKIGVSKNVGGTTETAIQPILLANLLTEGYIPYVASGGAGSSTINSKVSDSWLKVTTDTLELGASDPISHQIRYARFLWQAGTNDKISTVYGAKDITASIQYLGGSTTAKIEFTGGSGGGRIQFNDEYTFPATDGTSGQVLSTNGSGDLSWVAAGGPTTSDLQDVTDNGATTTNTIEVGGLTSNGNIVAEDAEVHVGDVSGDSWTRIKHAQADSYGFDWIHGNATVIVNEQGGTNEALVLGDTDTTSGSSGLFGISYSTDGGANWTKKLDLRGNGDLYVGSSGTTKVLTTADEGSGNGIDADTVDGLQASQFLRSDADDVATGTITFENGILIGTGDFGTSADRASIVFGEGSPTSNSMYIEYNGEGLSGAANSLYIGTYDTAGDIARFTYGGDIEFTSNNWSVGAGGTLSAVSLIGSSVTVNGEMHADSIDIHPNNLAGNARIRSLMSGGNAGLEFSDSADNLSSGDQYFLLGANDVAVGKFEIRFNSSAFTTGWDSEGTLLAEFKGDDNSVSFPSGNVFANNKLAIGTTTFTGDAKLLVGSYLSVGSAAVAQLNGFVRIRQQLIIHDDTDTSKEALLDYNATNGFSFISSNGGSNNFGIGTTTPDTHLDVSSGVHTKLRVQTTGVADASVEILGYDAGVHIGDPTNGNRWAIWNDGVSTTSKLGFGSYALGGWYTDGAQVMTLTHDGKVGIGTTTPSAKLDVNGTVALGNGSQAIQPDADLTIRVGNEFAGLDFKSTRTSGNIGGLRWFDSNNTMQTQLLVQVDGTLNYYDEVSGVSRLYIDGSSGDVTIGGTACIKMQEDHFINLRFDINDNNNSVQYILLCVNAGGNDVNGTIRMDRTSGLRHACSVDIIVSAGSSLSPVGGLRAHGVAGLGEPEYRLVTCTYSGTSYIALEISNPDYYYETSGAYFTGRIVSTGQKLVPVLASGVSSVANFESNSEHSVQGNFVVKDGWVGVGVGNPTYQVDVAGEVGIDSYIRHRGDDDTYFGFNADNSFKVRTGGGDRFVVDNNYSYISHKLSIGTTTTTTSAKLIVGGALSASSSAIGQFDGFLRIRDSIFLHDDSNTANEVRLRCTGSNQAQLTGTFTASSDIIAFSDARVKENVKTIDNALDKVLAMRGVSYNRTDQEDKSKKVGVIAQEIQKVLPEVVTENGDGMLGVSYGNIVGVLIEAIKEQQKQIDELKARLDGSTD